MPCLRETWEFSSTTPAWLAMLRGRRTMHCQGVCRNTQHESRPSAPVSFRDSKFSLNSSTSKLFCRINLIAWSSVLCWWVLRLCVQSSRLPPWREDRLGSVVAQAHPWVRTQMHPVNQSAAKSWLSRTCHCVSLDLNTGGFLQLFHFVNQRLFQKVH